MSVISIENMNPKDYFWIKKATDIVHISKPLIKFGINYFSACRIYEDGTNDCLSNNPLSQQVFLDHELWKHVFFGNVNQYRSGVVRMIDVASYDQNMINYLSLLRENLDIAHGIVIIYPKASHVEFYHFAAASENHKINHFYLNNIDILHNFVFYFNDVAKSLMNESFQNRIYYPNTQDKTLLTSGDVANSYSHNMNHDKSFSIMSDFYSLTRREGECAQLLMSGNCCKRMASKMNLSTRTIEKHLQSLRRKTNSHNYSQMFSKLYCIRGKDNGYKSSRFEI